MSKERESSYYEDIYTREDYLPKYTCHYTESSYYQMWLKVMQLIPKEISFVELGCGTGQFAKMLIDSKYKYMLGFDFSDSALRIAKKINLYDIFIKKDITREQFDHNFFIALEVFEHTKDFKVIENIGLGKEIIFTVPDFDDAAHVRYFKSINEVVERYKNHIKFEYIEKFQSWFICKGVTI